MRIASLVIFAFVIACGAQPTPARDAADQPDLTPVFDFTTPATAEMGDMATPMDFAVAPDMAMPDAQLDSGQPDLTIVHDLFVFDDGTPDFAKPLDFSTTIDLAGADLATAPDLAKPDLSTVPDLSTPDLYHPAMSQTIPYTQAFAGSNQVNDNTTVAPNTAVTVVTQTTPRGSAKTVEIHWTINTQDNTIVETFDMNQPTQGNDQWYGIIPGQAQGTTVTWYVKSIGWDGTTQYYSNLSKNFHYTSN